MKNTVSWAPALAAALSLLASAAQAQEATGDWHGVLKVGPSELRLGLTVTAGPDGAMTGQLPLLSGASLSSQPSWVEPFAPECPS